MIRLFRQRKKPVDFPPQSRGEGDHDATPRLGSPDGGAGGATAGGARPSVRTEEPPSAASVRLAIRPGAEGGSGAPVNGSRVPPRPAASPLDTAGDAPSRRAEPAPAQGRQEDGPLSAAVRPEPRGRPDSARLTTATPTEAKGGRTPGLGAASADATTTDTGRRGPDDRRASAGPPARAETPPVRGDDDARRPTGEGRFWFTNGNRQPGAAESAASTPEPGGAPNAARTEDRRGRSGSLVSFGFGRRRDPEPQPPAIAGPSVPATLADTRRTDTLPRFRRRAVAPEHESQLTPIERARADLLDAFSPGRPKAGARDFSGRGTQIGEIIAAIEELGASVVLYGERGLGKTTLANTLSEIATEAGYVIARRPCDSETTYDSLMRSLLRGLSIRFASREIGDRMPPGSTFEALLPERDLRAADVTDALKRLSIVRVIFVVDEFDRSVDQRLRVQMAETIKILADERVPVHFVVIGVAETLQELVGVHPSLERNLAGVRMPLMSFDEIDAMIDRGEAITGMCYDRAARQRIAYLSCGTPYAAQLLCLYAGTHALSRESFDVGVQDVGFALHRTLNALDRSVVEAYDAATRGGKAEWLVDILFAAATAPADNFGRFDLNDASEAARQHEALPALPAIRLSRGLYELAKPGTCQVLARETTPTGEIRYRFTNQLMRLYTLARQAQARGLI